MTVYHRSAERKMKMMNKETVSTAAAVRNDRDAFEKLYGTYRDRLYFFAKKYTGSKEAAEDIVSETFITALEKLSTLRDEEAVGSWLYSIAYNKCMDQLKASSRALPLEDGAQDDLNAPVMLPDDYAVNEQLRTQLRDMIDSLSPEARSAVILYYYEEMSLEEVAKAMNINENAAKQRLFRARQTIRTKIEKLVGKGAVFAAVPLGAVLNSTAELTIKQTASAGAAASGGAAKVAGMGFAAKAAAVGAAAVLAVGIPVGLSKLHEGGDFRSEDSSTVERSVESNDEKDSRESDDRDSDSRESDNKPVAEAVFSGSAWLGENSADIGKDQSGRISELIGQLKEVDLTDYTVLLSNEDWKMNYIAPDYNRVTLTRYPSNKGWILMDEKKAYEDSPELNELVMSLLISENNSSNTAREWYSVAVDEPVTEEDYVNAAVKCCEGWLTSLQSEDTDDYYRNKGFEITVTEEESSQQKCNYLSCGIVNGVKEFVVEICFTAEHSGSNTFYDKYYQEGRYTEAGTFWSGQYICGRFRWENGQCKLINFGTRDESAAMQNGLNGINSSEYRTFFDFARRTDLEKAISDSFVPYGRLTVSRNLTQTEDGTPINIDIYANSADSEQEDSYTAIWDQRAYINGKATYSTGLYFTDNGTGHMPDTLPKDFKLTFDNYDGDANPDFCCRYDADENGTYYVLESVQTDGRIFNLSGRAFSGGIYIAGCTDPSPRLQKTDECKYIGWKNNGDRYYPTNESGSEIDLPQLNMYSDRFYLPDDKKLYGEDEDKVTCFIWNNTYVPLTTDDTYSIEMLDREEWKEVASGLSGSSVTIQPRECAEVTFDISALGERVNTQYRIVQKSGQITGYGRFWCAGTAVQNASAKSKSIVAGAHSGDFTVNSRGVITTEVYKAELRDGSASFPLSISKTDDMGDYSFIAAQLPDKAGDYTLVLNDSIECGIKLTDPTQTGSFKVGAELNGDDIKVTVTPPFDCKLRDCIADNGSISLPFYTDEEQSLRAGTESTFTLHNYTAAVMKMDSSKMEEDLYRHYQEDDEFADYGIPSGLSREEFLEQMNKLMTFDSGTIELVFNAGDQEYKAYTVI